MSFEDKDEVGKFTGEEGELDEALSNFRLSVHAWSDAEFSRPRAAVQHVRRRIWRLAAGWALGCVLIAGTASGGVYQHLHRQQLARIEAARIAEQQRLAAIERARQEEDLLAKVDSVISREVPSAMEPLARLMAEDEAK
jgi:hypothetical protein